MVAIMYIGALVIYEIIDPHNCLFIILDGKILRGLFEHERLKPGVIRINQGNIYNLPHLKQVLNLSSRAVQ